MATKSDAIADTPVEVTTNTLGHYLVVRHAFDAYRKGDAIRDEATITAILKDDQKKRSVHKVIE
ncbi:hypothetical protein [Paraburkholderia nemoris]|uniref:hypothetical protein n=1 Tax=Paraburkholderia nemoris TaxID=2793076 RepID=UPI001B21E19C|nr:hypothetical protein [Paraburkholderia nemoris]CAE6838336.1 hypothetical protein R75777_06943 [Paraburkholderia nemoris]